jgi:hypothetical protein
MVSELISEVEMEALPRMLTRLKLTAIRDRLDELLNEAGGVPGRGVESQQQ